MSQASLSIVNQILNGKPQAVAISQTAQVVSNTFEIGADDALAISFMIVPSAVTGTAGIVKLQHSVDTVAANFIDVDATNAKVTLASLARFPLIMNATATNFLAKMPLFKYLRFVATTTGSDTCTLASIYVQLHV